MNIDEYIIQVLNSQGLKATRPRQFVYKILREIDGHWSVDEIAGFIKQRGHRVTRMSVYNAIDALMNAGLVMCADVGPGRALYEANVVWHHHFVCRSCREVRDIPCIEEKKPCLMPPEDIDGTVDEAQVIFRGICKKCLKTQQKTTLQNNSSQEKTKN